MIRPYHLSVVATSRNDNHGGSLTYRMQHFVNGFVEQCKRHDLNAELILVEWNPPDDRPPLAEALQFPSDMGPCDIRIIRVPKEVHMQYKHAEDLPLFQMIAKNVGIKRAKGKFILATNIDILFSDEVICYMRDKLIRKVLYRADRLDVPNELPKTETFDEILTFCKESFFRINGKFGTVNITDKMVSMNMELPRSAFAEKIETLKRTYRRLASFTPIEVDRKIPRDLHTNGCGDFTLLSYADWERLRGYPEWDIFSFHIDSVLLFQAHRNEIIELDLPKKMPVYHIEHGPGSGYSAEAAHILFKRIEEKGITYLKESDFRDIVEKIYESPTRVLYNDENWGLSKLSLDEVWI